MNILVASSRRKHGISQWIPVLLAASFCLTVAISAQAVVIEWDYDGTYYPTDDPPPAGQSTWSVTRTGTPDVLPNTPGAGVASFLDDVDGARLAMQNVFTEGTFISQPGNAEWEYSFKTSFTGWQGEDGKSPFFGVRDEGGSGKCVMYSPSQDGTKLFYIEPQDGLQYGDLIWEMEVGGDPLTNEYHTYEVLKYLDGSDVMQVAFRLDDVLVDTRPYADLVDDKNGLEGFGIWTSTPGTSDYMVDNAQFCCDTPPIEPRTVTETFRYDGTYQPDTLMPPSGQSRWNVVTTPPLTPGNIQPNTPEAGVAKVTDDAADGRIQINNVFTDAEFIANPLLFEWQYDFKMSMNSLEGTSVLFGLRDEGGNGRSIMFGHSPDGDLFYTDGTNPLGELLYDAEGLNPSLIDGQSHTYRVIKDVKGDGSVDVLFYLDDELLDTRDYFSLLEDAGADNGFGVWTSTPGLAEFLLDNIYFGPGSGGEPIPGDANLDNIVNDADASILAAHWQETQEGAAAVPEPSTVVLLAFAAASMLVWWRRK